MRDTVAPGVTSRPLLIAGAAVPAALAGTLLVWAQYGTMVFFERAGWSRASADGVPLLNAPERSFRTATVLGAFLCGLVLVFGAILFVAGRSSSIGPMVATVGGPFHLVDQDGKPVSDEDMKGRPFLVFFGFTHCPDVCPTTLFDMSQMLHALGPDAGRIGALFITVDPERDTPTALKDYLSSFDPHLRGLTGDPAAVDAALKAYRVYAKKVPLKDGDYTMDHTAVVYLMDKNGRFVAPFNMKRTAEAEAADLRGYL